MTQIKVDPAKLEQLSKDLDSLRLEFEGIGATVEDHTDAVGRPGKLIGALDDVATNWSKKRQDVVDRLAALADLALAAARHYREAERKIAGGFGAEGPAG